MQDNIKATHIGPPKINPAKSAILTVTPLHVITVLKCVDLLVHRPGMTRVSFPYFMDQEAVDYIVKAVIMVAKEGWKLLSQVRHN